MRRIWSGTGPLSSRTLNKIKENMPSWANVGNPADIEPLFETVGPEESIKIAVEAALEDENVDGVILIFVAVPRLIPYFEIKRAATYLKEINTERKPILAYLLGYKETVDSWSMQLEEEGVPVYSSIERCVKALGCLWKYKMYNTRGGESILGLLLYSSENLGEFFLKGYVHHSLYHYSLRLRGASPVHGFGSISHRA
jgi:acyl-CoA synthetase (NDP forming)